MPTYRLRVAGADAEVSREVRAALAALRSELDVPEDFPADVAAEAASAAARGAEPGLARTDLRDVPFLTIDPAGSMDLDQALHLATTGDGFAVRYAIADVAAFVAPGGPLDDETHRRGSTLYGPDGRTPLHPAVLSEGAASLLPDADRPAVVWTIGLDARGEITSVRVERATVRSVARLSYDEAQAMLGDGTEGVPSPDVRATIGLLRTVGTLRQALEVERGGVSLDVPEQVVVTRDDGTVTLELRSTLPVEAWNAQISLLTGIAAARLMRQGGVGILRTLPPADPRDLERLRRTALALGIDWPAATSYGSLLATLDGSRPRDAAFLTEATSLFRGASYLAFGGTDLPQGVPAEGTEHAAIAAEYAHVTAPLRRLVDRYGTEAALAVAAGTTPPGWVLDGLAALPRTMARTGQRASAYERGCLDVVEAALVEHHVGEVFDGVVVDVADAPREDGLRTGRVVVAEPALRGPVTGRTLPRGVPVRVRLVAASVAERTIAFELLEPTP